MAAALLLGGCGNTSSSQESAVDSTVTSQTSEASAVTSETGEASEIPAVSQVLPEDTESQTQETAAAPVDQASWQVIQQYGFQEQQDSKNPVGQDSLLSYSLDPSTLTDEGDYYTVNATFAKPITVSPDLKVGDVVTITVNELTGETEDITLGENGDFTSPEGYEYYYFFNDMSINEDGDIVLYEGSDDRVDAPFYEGKLCISKEALMGIALENGGYNTVTKEDLTTYTWYNGVYFDNDGVVQSLIIYGD
jgi:hypothetical protein